MSVNLGKQIYIKPFCKISIEYINANKFVIIICHICNISETEAKNVTALN